MNDLQNYKYPEFNEDFEGMIPDGESALPEVTASDNGKVLSVVSGEWNKADAPKELPNVTASDNGKVLQVVGGSWDKAVPGTVLTGDAYEFGKIVTLSGTVGDVISSLNRGAEAIIKLVDHTMWDAESSEGTIITEYYKLQNVRLDETIGSESNYYEFSCETTKSLTSGTALSFTISSSTLEGLYAYPLTFTFGG